MTAPEQFAKWQESAIKAWRDDCLIDIGQPAHTAYIAGYLRRCQETEQIMKLAKFGARVLSRLGSAAVHGGAEMWDMAGTHGLLMPCQSDLNEVTESLIKELLK